MATSMHSYALAQNKGLVEETGVGKKEVGVHVDVTSVQRRIEEAFDKEPLRTYFNYQKELGNHPRLKRGRYWPFRQVELMEGDHQYNMPSLGEACLRAVTNTRAGALLAFILHSNRERD